MKKTKLPVLLQISYKELLKRRKLLIFMVINLFLGLLSFILINSFKTSLDSHINGKSQEMMTADMRVFARRALNSDELQFLQNGFGASNISTRVSYFTMVQNTSKNNNNNNNNNSNSHFSEIQIISTNFPLYGEVQFVNFAGQRVDSQQVMQTISSTNAVAIYPEVRYALGIEEGDTLQVGQQSFTAQFIVEKDAGAEINFSGLAPKIYIAQQQYNILEIAGKGNVVRHYAFIKTSNMHMPAFAQLSELHNKKLQNLLQKRSNNPQSEEDEEANGTYNESNGESTTSPINAIPPTNPDELEDYLEKAMTALLGKYDSPLSVRSHTGSGSQIERVLNFITRYLSLVSLIALFLSGVGIAYLFRNFVHDKLKETAVLRTLGLSQNETFLVALLQLMLIGIISSTLTAIAAYFLVPYLPQLFQRFLPEGFAMYFSWKSITATYLLSLMGAVVFCLPILVATKNLSLSYLFTGQIRFYNNKKLPLVLCFLLIAGTFFITSVWLSNSLEIGSIFSASFFGFFLLLFAAGIAIVYSLKLLLGRLPFMLDFSIKSIHHHRFSTIFYFLSIALGVMLITTITQMEKTITNEIQRPEGATLPTFFLFNIPQQQLPALQQHISAQGQQLKNASPLIGARLVAINNKEINASEDISENPNNTRRWRRRDNRRVNLSFRDGLIPGEELVDGQPLNTPQAGKENLLPISIEEGYAQERNVSMGDVLSFQMLDVPVTLNAYVHNVRKVQWNTFQPNFWLIFRPQALEAFPKIYLAMISGVPEEEKSALQSSIVRAFPDVSMIDVLKIIKEVLDIVTQLGVLVQVMALFSITLGLFILFSIVNYQVLTKWKEINLLKILGYSFYKIATLVVLEYLTLGILSLISGIGAGVALSYFLSSAFFENSFSLALANIIYLAAFICFMIIIIVGFAIQKPLRESANVLLKENAI